MEELKLLVESIANLPDLAIWVIAMYFFFKLAIVGSIFGVVRLFIVKVYDYFKGHTDLKNNALELEERKAELESQKPIVNLYNVGSLRLSSSEEISGLIIKLFGTIKDDTEAYSYIRAEDLKKAIKILEAANTNN
jgi:hypothetical protein